MRKISLSLILIAGCMQQSFAQANNNVPEPVKVKMIDHSVGVQLNGLIRQVFNFNNSTASTVVNPYLLTYNLTFKRSMWGIRAGVGYNYVSNTTNDGVTATETNINDMQARVGGEKVFRLSDKWTTAAGLDFVYRSSSNKTANTLHSFDTTITDTKSTGTGLGGGPMAWLRYSITDHIQVGTEASFYYVSTESKEVLTLTRKTNSGGGGGSIITSTETTTKPKNAQGTFSSPIVFYLIIKF